MSRARGGVIQHGHFLGRKPSGTYVSWSAMKGRCQRPSNNRYRMYGARGITVCERWQKFTNFLADMGERPEGTSLDRIDNNGNYEPGNCRWATGREQRLNSRNPNRGRKPRWMAEAQEEQS